MFYGDNFPEDMIDAIVHFDRMKRKKQYRFIRHLLTDESVFMWLFKPPKDVNLEERVSKFYNALVLEAPMRIIIDTLDNLSDSKKNRSLAVYMYSLCKIAVDLNNERNEKKDADTRYTDPFESIPYGFGNFLFKKEDSRISVRLASKIASEARHMVKASSKKLANNAYVSREIAQLSLLTIPEPHYVDTFKIGVYLNLLFTDMYQVIGQDITRFDTRVKWDVFFRVLFGKEHLVDVATFILLEGAHRLTYFKKDINSDNIELCWHSLTEFALNTLEKTDEPVRKQMIELYLKRLDKMFTNGTFELRVNLLKLESKYYPNFVNTIDLYRDKIDEIVSRDLRL